MLRGHPHPHGYLWLSDVDKGKVAQATTEEATMMLGGGTRGGARLRGHTHSA